MNNYQRICNKLEAFIRKYYVNQLIKGIILFFAIGLIYFLISVSMEYFFWLGKGARTLLFWLFILVEVGLFAWFIVYPLTQLFKITKGIDYVDASSIIGKYFPEVSDKLLNVLQLKNDSQTESELLLASIDQKAEELQPIPFKIAINYKSNLKYLKYAIIPLLVLFAIYISGKSKLFSESYDRMVNYQQAYEPPAPFSFVIMNPSLAGNENESFKLRVQTEGTVTPEDASINFKGETYFMKALSPGVFEYDFDKLSEPVSFNLSANEVISRPYTLDVSSVPTLLGFEMLLKYPSYLKKNKETVKGTGSATIPEGTQVSWKLKAKNTNEIRLQLADTVLNFKNNAENFSAEKIFTKTTYYGISTSNEHVRDYEKLSYQLRVIPDERPRISIEMKRDTVTEETLYFRGKVSDDYGIAGLELVYYPSGERKSFQKRRIAIGKGTVHDFVYAFPDTLNLKPGTAYELYFQVFDNDGFNGRKQTKSKTFSFRKLTESENEDKQLNNQDEAIKGMNQSLQEMKKGNEELKEIDQLQKEKKELNYNDRKKLENFLKRQQLQEQMMKDYSEKLKKNLEEFQPDKQDDFKENLKKRLERNEKKLKENEKLLEELEKYQDKLQKEELNQKLEKVARNRKNEQKNLEQLLELTKRYYVEQKAKKIASDLQKLAEKQESAAKEENQKENSSEAQKELNKTFEELKKEMEKLKKENEQLKDPMELGMEKEKQESASEDQQEATESLEKKEEQEEKEAGDESEQGEQDAAAQQQKAQEKQKSAAQKMQKMSQQMQGQMAQGGAQQEAEDAQMLRQVLDNLVTFSFQQEDLMIDFKSMGPKNPDYPSKLRYQNSLRENFKHIDDSLYALALRNPIISEQITEKLTDVEFNMDKALERLAQNELRTGVSSQQYVFKNANDLANMLSDALNQMQMQMKASGKGSGSPSQGQGEGEGGRGFQLSDIIQKQGELSEKMGGEKPGEKPGESGKEGEQGKGKDGKQGEGKDGKGEGENGEGKGEGKGEGNGQDGKQGKNGQMQNGSEQMSGELYEIFKQQQELRKQLEDMIQKEGLGPDAKRLARSMENIEQDLLRNGFTQRTESRMQMMKHQLMKLKDAVLEQGQEEKRESKTNRKQYDNKTKANLEKAKDYFNTTEILNRQSLPLRQNYKIIVQDYFKQN